MPIIILRFIRHRSLSDDQLAHAKAPGKSFAAFLLCRSLSIMSNQNPAIQNEGKELPFHMNYIPEFVQAKCELEFNETHERKKQSIQDLRNFLKSKWDPNELPFDYFKRIAVITFSQLFRDPMTQINGIKVIYDFDGTELHSWSVQRSPHFKSKYFV
ncbi:unnamed protein product [Larinioides sclopetarius]|uniref:Uncharacterized protein n=1 Tax=Larinioides sclopetarius TaxID=280406 RepID=A0AAV2A507_9ARAC